MYCVKCGSQIDDLAVFCTACGNKVEKNKIKGGKAVITAITLLICVIVLFGVILGGNKTKKSQKDRQEVVKEENITQNQEEINYIDLEKEKLVSSSEKELFQLQNKEVERIWSEYAELKVEPAMYVGKLYEGYYTESNEYIEDVYYLWLKKTEEVEFELNNGEIKSVETKGIVIEGDNLDPLLGEEVVVYGKAIESSYKEKDVALLSAIVLPLQNDLKEYTYLDRPNAIDNPKSTIRENTVQNYQNMLHPNPIRPETIDLQITLDTIYGASGKKVELFGGYMLEDLDNDDVPELILTGMLDGYCVFFIMNPDLEISVVPGEVLYNVPNQNLFYTAEGYDDYIFYACWYRGRHDGSKGEESFTYMKAFENGRNENGDYVGYDYSNVILGQNTMVKKSYDISNKLDELFTQVEMPVSYDYTDLSPFDSY